MITASGCKSWDYAALFSELRPPYSRLRIMAEEEEKSLTPHIRTSLGGLIICIVIFDLPITNAEELGSIGSPDGSRLSFLHFCFHSRVGGRTHAIKVMEGGSGSWRAGSVSSGRIAHGSNGQ